MINTITGMFHEKRELTPDVSIFSFVPLDVRDSIDFRPGQYLIMLIPQGTGEYARRLYSLINTPESKDSFELLAKIISGGVASEYFKKLQKGDEVLFQGPAGVFTLKESERKKVFVATGTGIAPILSMLRAHLAHDPTTPYNLIWGLKTVKDVYCFPELRELARQYPNFTFTIHLSREENLDTIASEDRQFFDVGRVNKKLDEMLDATSSMLHDTDFYVCGDRDIVESLRQYLLDKGVEKQYITFEKFV